MGTNSLIIPIYDAAKRLVGWVSRQSEGKKPKYLYSPDFRASFTLFGEYNITERGEVCLTEGPLDTMWLDQNGYKSLAIFGLNLSKHQESKLAKLPITELIMCLDRDEPGRRSAKQLYERVKKYFPVSIARIPEPYKDVQDIRSKTQLQQIIKNRK